MQVPIRERMRYLVSQNDCHQITKAMGRKLTAIALKISAGLGAIALGSCNATADLAPAPSPPEAAPASSATQAQPKGLTLPFGQRKSAINTLAQAYQAGQTVYVQGTVQQQAALLEGSLYQLQDSTGSIWVKTTQTPPTIGETIAIKGTLRYKPILVNGTDIGEHYLEEVERGAAPE
jgi:uncharacterized protein YdeI (BOF family)